MAVSRMRKIQLLAHKSAKAEVIAALRERGVLHISEPSVELAAAEDAERRERERELAARLAKLEYLRSTSTRSTSA
jgi:vacuolar-type H+-ATPase subunit I/STV1